MLDQSRLSIEPRNVNNYCENKELLALNQNHCSTAPSCMAQWKQRLHNNIKATEVSLDKSFVALACYVVKARHIKGSTECTVTFVGNSE